MPVLRKTGLLSFLGFVVVLGLAIFFRPQNVEFQEQKTFPEVPEGEYGDVIGIELGRTYSRVGIMRNNTFDLIADEKGHTVVPSYVSLTSQGASLVGFEAMEQVATNPRNTVYDVRRLIGRKFFDHPFQADIADLPYEVIENNGYPSVKVQIEGADKLFALEEISAKVLAKLKDMAQQHLNHKLANAVIAVPAYFNDNQRQAIKDAAIIAGLSALRTVNEPTAAGIAHGLEISPRESFSIIYNLGAKESDAVLAEVDRGVYDTLAHANDHNFGGETFENVLLDHTIIQFEAQHLLDSWSKQITSAYLQLEREVDQAKLALLNDHLSRSRCQPTTFP